MTVKIESLEIESSASDCFRVEVIATGKGALSAALALASAQHRGGVRAWMLSNKSLALYWYPKPDTVPFPYPLKFPLLVEFVWGWLEQLSDDVRGHPPSTDGSTSHGFRVETPQVEGLLAKISFHWMVHGK